MRKATSLGLLAAIGAITAAIFFVSRQNENTHQRTDVVTETAPLAAQDSQRKPTLETATPSRIDLAQESAADRKPEPSNTFLLNSQEAAEKAQGFTNAYALYREYSEAATIGDPSAKYVIYKVFEQCYGSTGRSLIDRSPAEVLANVENPSYELVTHYFEMKAKCESLHSAQLDSEKYWHAYRRDAIEDGFPLSVLDWSAAQLAGKNIEGISGIHHVLASGDLFAIAQIGLAVPEHLLPLTDSAALMFLACDLSEDCTGFKNVDIMSYCKGDENCAPGEGMRGAVQRFGGQNMLDDVEQRVIEMKEAIELHGFSGIELNWVAPE